MAILHYDDVCERCNDPTTQWRTQEFFRGRGAPGIYFWGVQQIQLRPEGRENGDLGALAP
jgi:hypothetical protein